MTNTVFRDTRFFYQQRLTEIGKKIKYKQGNIKGLSFCYLEIIRFLHPRYHLK